MNVLYRSQCTDGKVLDGQCSKPPSEHAFGRPCEDGNSCSLSSRACVKGYCHDKCTNTGEQKCITVDGVSIIWNESCSFFESYKCEAFGDKYCRNGKCENRAPEGGICYHEDSLDECGGDKIQKCSNSRCIPTCLTDDNCGSGQICDNYGNYHGVCIGKSFSPWAIGVIVVGILTLLISTCAIIIIIKQKRKEKKESLAGIPQKPLIPYSPANDAPAHSRSNPIHLQQYGQVQTQQCFVPTPLQYPPHNSNNSACMNNNATNEMFRDTNDLPNYSATAAIINANTNDNTKPSNDSPNYLTSTAEVPHYIDCTADSHSNKK